MFNVIDSGLTEYDKKLIISDINYLFDNGIWCHTVPHFQTWPNLFNHKESHWNNLCASFKHALEKISYKKTVSLKCWAYKSFHQVPSEYQVNSWHKHDSDTKNKISAILYLLYPQGSNGTEYIDENGENKIMPHKKNHWTFFPSHTLHRPGFWDHKNMYESRIVIAVDSYFE